MRRHQDEPHIERRVLVERGRLIQLQTLQKTTNTTPSAAADQKVRP